MVTPFMIPSSATSHNSLYDNMGVLDSLRHFIPQNKLTLILYTDKTFSDPLLVD